VFTFQSLGSSVQIYRIHPNSSEFLKVLFVADQMLALKPRAGPYGKILASMACSFSREVKMKIANPRPVRPTRHPGRIMAAGVWVLALILPSAPVADDDDDGYDYYERPPDRGGLIDSYDRYNPQLYRRLYPDRVPNNYDYEPREPAVSEPSPLCLYTCPGGPLDAARD